jgi:hypothetical protein
MWLLLLLLLSGECLPALALWQRTAAQCTGVGHSTASLGLLLIMALLLDVTWL